MEFKTFNFAFSNMHLYQFSEYDYSTNKISHNINEEPICEFVLKNDFPSSYDFKAKIKININLLSNRVVVFGKNNSGRVTDEIYLDKGNHKITIDINGNMNFRSLVIGNRKLKDEETIIQVDKPSISISNNIKYKILNNLISNVEHKSESLVHSQNEFCRININFSDDDFENFLNNKFFLCEIKSSCPIISSYTLDLNENLIGNEKYHFNYNNEFKINIPLTRNAKQIVFRNASYHSSINDFKLSSYKILRNYVNENDEKNLNNKFIYIHTWGKTGSITLEKNLQNFNKLEIGRIHFFNENIKNYRERTEYYLENYRALTLWDKINKSIRTNQEVITVIGLRKTESMIVSSIFEQIGNDLYSRKLSIEEVLKEIIEQYPSYLNSLRNWWLSEFFDLYKIDKDYLFKNIKKQNFFWRLSLNEKRKFLFYRIEDSDEAIKAIVENLTKQKIEKVEKFNQSKDKKYSEIYNETLSLINFYELKKMRYQLLNEIESFFY